MAWSEWLAELEDAEDPKAAWRPVARTLARLASTGRGTQLRALVAELAQVQAGTEWAEGFAEALRTVGGALDRSLREDQARAELVTMAASHDWQRLLPWLQDWITPTELSEHTAMHKAQLSRVLANMHANHIVEVQRGQTDARRRFFRLTLRGQQLVQATGLAEAPTDRIGA
ncbi:MAG: hypothetical protein AAGA48_22150 [Myxococcota bacterium]